MIYLTKDKDKNLYINMHSFIQHCTFILTSAVEIGLLQGEYDKYFYDKVNYVSY